jgi:GNAT superfamily N-acetyltransferase
MAPLARNRAVAFWRRIADDLAADRRALLVAEDARGISGTVQLVLDMPDNQPHRADLCKMLVHPRARRQGLGAALMAAAEDLARECGRTLLVVRVGDISRYALMPDGSPCGTTYFYRDLQ